MMKLIKSVVRWLCITLRIPLTKNLEYDIQTERILKTVLHPHSNCIDIGAHKGEILDLFMKYANDGKHIAFEPIPYLFEGLKSKYGQYVEVMPYALSTYNGKTEFNLVLNDPAYSGLKQRQYKSKDTSIDKIMVEVRTLDELVLDRSSKIDLIKIDVEGGEFDVLKGAKGLLSRDKPLLVFECGKGASDFYGTDPHDIFNYLQGLGYQIATLKGFLKNESLSAGAFAQLFTTGEEYYFVGR
jgi:FkbM family methyltransferase